MFKVQKVWPEQSEGVLGDGIRQVLWASDTYITISYYLLNHIKNFGFYLDWDGSTGVLRSRMMQSHLYYKRNYSPCCVDIRLGRSGWKQGELLGLYSKNTGKR